MGYQLKETQRFVDCMAIASGFDEDELISKSRKWPLPACRWFIGSELVDLGYPSTIAAKEIGLDHATLLYGRKKIKVMHKTRRWKWENEIHEKFKKLINADKQ